MYQVPILVNNLRLFYFCVNKLNIFSDADLLTFNSTLLIAAFTTWIWNDRRVSTM